MESHSPQADILPVLSRRALGLLPAVDVDEPHVGALEWLPCAATALLGSVDHLIHPLHPAALGPVAIAGLVDVVLGPLAMAEQGSDSSSPQ